MNGEIFIADSFIATVLDSVSVKELHQSIFIEDMDNSTVSPFC